MMKPGDLVRMNYTMWWKCKGSGGQRQFTESPAMLLELIGKTQLLILTHEGRRRKVLAENYELV